MPTIPPKCGCNLDVFKDSKKLRPRLVHCPNCGKYIYNIFIGEKYRTDNKDSPFKELIKNLVYEKENVKGEIYPPFNTSSSLWDEIHKGIDNSDICLFDISEERFNVGYEIGYSIGKQKIIFLGCCNPVEEHENFSNWKLFKCPSKDDVFFKILEYKKYLEQRGVEDQKIYEIFENYNLEKMCEQLKKRCYTSDYDSIWNTHYGFTEPQFKEDKKDILIVTSKKYCNSLSTYLNSLKIPNLGKLDIKIFDNVVDFSLDPWDTIKLLFDEIYNKYDYFIGHLMAPSSTMSENLVKMHNFIIGILSGIFSAKPKGREHCSFIIKKGYIIDSFTDKKPKTYTNMLDAKKILKTKLEKISIQ
jgi:hypothetical protein